MGKLPSSYFDLRNGKIDKTATVSPRLETDIDITIIKQDEKRPRSKVHVDVNASNYYESITKSNRALESDQRSLDTLGIR